MTPETWTCLRCPICRAKLADERDALVCLAAGGERFPIVDGVPVLLHEAASVFSVADVVARRAVYFEPPRTGWRARARRLLPSLDLNILPPAHYRSVAAACRQVAPRPRVLVIGGGVLGHGMGALANDPGLEIVPLDVSLGPRTALVADAHDLPFEDGAVHGVVIQAVLEHVLDPARCVAEIHRVLAPGGIVYAETPFMQQVHGGRYDFTRWTARGHRRLFRWFEELDSGAACGPGMALAWAYRAWVQALPVPLGMRPLLTGLVHATAWWLARCDPWLTQQPQALDAAAGVYFLGRRAETPLTDRALIDG